MVLVPLFLCVVGVCAASPGSRPAERHESDAPQGAAGRAPAWVKRVPARMAEVLVERHLDRKGPVWGLARRDPDGKLYGDLAYEEIGSAGYCRMVREYDLWDQVPPLSDSDRKKALAFWQSWQEPDTGRFRDPRDPKRLVGEKYVVNLITFFGGQPLHTQKQTRQMLVTDESGRMDTTEFLQRTKNDPDWKRGGWAAGSHTAFIAVQILDAVNNGHPELIPDLEAGIANILSHQDPASGLWGPPDAGLDQRIGGTLKVVSRLYFSMGLNVPHAERLADSLIKHEQNRDWYKVGESFCVPQNVVYMVAFCLEASDYRRDDLLGVLKSKVREYQEWIQPDGTMLLRRGDPASACVENVHLNALGILSEYLGWKDSPLKSPIEMDAVRKKWASMRYRPTVLPDGSVRVVSTSRSAGSQGDSGR